MNRQLASFDAGNNFLWVYSIRSMFMVTLTVPYLNKSSRPAIETLESAADRQKAIGYQLVMLMQLLMAAGQIYGIQYVYNILSGNAARYCELLDKLEEINKQEVEQRISNVVSGKNIEFKNCTIETPTKNVLVRNLSFAVGDNDSMLLTGHNGAGKSSVFRCLAGLWHIDNGQITRPGGAAVSGSLAGTVYYLPQKPYQVLGTLFDQISYPAESSEGLTRERVLEILEEVELGYLGRPDTRNQSWIKRRNGLDIV